MGSWNGARPKFGCTTGAMVSCGSSSSPTQVVCQPFDPRASKHAFPGQQLAWQASGFALHFAPAGRHCCGAASAFVSCGSSCLAAEVSMSKQIRFSLLAPAALISMVPLASFAGMSLESCTSTLTPTAPFATGHFKPSQVMVPTPSGNLMTLEEQTSPE